jgi:hypothetical protein
MFEKSLKGAEQQVQKVFHCPYLCQIWPARQPGPIRPGDRALLFANPGDLRYFAQGQYAVEQ